MSPLGTADSARQQLHKRWLLLERKRNIVRKATLRFAFYFLEHSNGRTTLSVLMTFDQAGWLAWVCCAFSLLATVFALLLSWLLRNLLEPAHLLTFLSLLLFFFFLTHTILRSQTYTSWVLLWPSNRKWSPCLLGAASQEVILGDGGL